MSLDVNGLGLLFAALEALPERIAALERATAQMQGDVREIAAALPSPLVSVETAASLLSVSLPTVRRWVRARQIPVLRIGRTVRIDVRGLKGVDAKTIANLAAKASSRKG